MDCYDRVGALGCSYFSALVPLRAVYCARHPFAVFPALVSERGHPIVCWDWWCVSCPGLFQCGSDPLCSIPVLERLRSQQS